MIGRLVIDDIRPTTPLATHPAKAVVGERIQVSADIFKEGHDVIASRFRWRKEPKGSWSNCDMNFIENDRFEGFFTPSSLGCVQFIVQAWTDRFASWSKSTLAKIQDSQDVSVDLQDGILLLEKIASKMPKRSSETALISRCVQKLAEPGSFMERFERCQSDEIKRICSNPAIADDLTSSPKRFILVERPVALKGAWYEMFPRSEGGLRSSAKQFSRIKDMGFDVVYFPPIHPIGHSHRKGANNSLTPSPTDPGSPWAIGSSEGGHMSIAAELGDFEDFSYTLEEARRLGIELSLDYALQCSPDHPWVKDHPEWFHKKSDGSIAFAENPPKKYQDIVPINFWPDKEDDRIALWEACRQILQFWIEKGIKIFRVDNPHTKPIAFWEWVLGKIHSEHPDVVFLAEAFTRPKVMAKLAQVGFSQSYTYFTWRTSAEEIRQYLLEITQPPLGDYFRPNLWPNTPDILSGPLRNGPSSAFKIRLALAATLSASYGIYSGYEFCENQPASELNEEYLNSEKYEIKHRDWSKPSLAPWISKINSIRRSHPALGWNKNLFFHPNPNSQIIAYSKTFVVYDQSSNSSYEDVVLIVVNLDPYNVQQSVLDLDMTQLHLDWDEAYEAYDELSSQSFFWQGSHPFVRLDPGYEPLHILHIRKLQ